MMQKKQQRIQGSKPEDSEGSEKSKGGLDSAKRLKLAGIKQ